MGEMSMSVRVHYERVLTDEENNTVKTKNYKELRNLHVTTTTEKSQRKTDTR